SQARCRRPCSTTADVAMSRGAAVAVDRASSARSIGTLAIPPTCAWSITTTKLRITASRSRRHEVEWTRTGGPPTSRTIRSTPGTTIDELGRAFDAGEVVRTHGPRPTWHFLVPEELRRIEAIVGPRVQRSNDMVGRRRLGFERTDFERTTEIIRDALAGGRVR